MNLTLNDIYNALDLNLLNFKSKTTRYLQFIKKENIIYENKNFIIKAKRKRNKDLGDIILYFSKCECNKIIISLKINELYCTECSSKYKHKRFGICSTCKKETYLTNLSNFTECYKCYNSKLIRYAWENNLRSRKAQANVMSNNFKTGKIKTRGMYIDYCNICNKNTYHFSTYCSICNPDKTGSITKTEKKYCPKCKTLTNHFGNRCKKCNPWESSKIEYKFCNTCKEITFHIGNRCRKCKPWIVKGKYYKLCNICNKNTLHIGNRCLECHPIKFNIEKFYNNKFKIIDNISFNNKLLNLKDINNFENIPGVYSIWGYKNNKKYCLNVCETKNIKKEILNFFRVGLRYKNKTNEEIKELVIKSNRKQQIKLYNRFCKIRNILSFNNIFIIIIKTNIKSKKLREKIEAQYAHDNKSLFWAPAPGQLSI